MLRKHCIILLQPPGLLSVAKTTYSNHGVIGFYKGVVPSVAGNALTLAIRFAVFDQLKSMMTDTEGKLTPTRTMFGVTNFSIMSTFNTLVDYMFDISWDMCWDARSVSSSDSI